MDETPKANALISETSPYLRMHAFNPVHWYPWNEESIAKARLENKPILLSIGYTACHWCHVMAKESFEDQQTADLMNTLFINIKVDREERPDLDKIYQLSYQLFTQQAGGWPLTVFLMPDTLMPFFVGTYFPKEDKGNLPAFKVILEYVAYFYRHHQTEIKQQNNSFQKIFEMIQQQDTLRTNEIDPKLLASALERVIANFDEEHGGFGSQPKFPLPSYLQLLLIMYDYSKEKSTHLKKVIEHSLKRMAERGLYDHLAGGFFRYCVDDNWTIPHFEKMLYDNAQLLSLYVEAYLIIQNEDFKHIALQTGNWLLRKMQSRDGGFFATLSADSEGEEGRYYVWTDFEIREALNDDEFAVIKKIYGLDSPPNFEDKWHLIPSKSPQAIVKELAISLDDVKQLIQLSHEKLLMLRDRRQPPEIDEKILVSWNALTIKSLLMAGYYFNNDDFIHSAHKALTFIKDKLWDGKKLAASYARDKVNQHVYLDDYAFLLYALLYSLSIKWDSTYLQFAISLIKTMISDFGDTANGGFYFTAKNTEHLLIRLKQQQDDAIPSGAAIATYSLLFFGFLLAQTDYISFAESSIKNALKQMREVPEAHCHFFVNLAAYATKLEIIILRGVEPEIQEWQRISKRYYHPFRIVFPIDNTEQDLPPNLQQKISRNNSVVAYYCHGFECKSEITSLEEFENVLRTQPYLAI